MLQCAPPISASERRLARTLASTIFKKAYTEEDRMKKEEAVEGVERAGHTINGLYVRAWETALHPTEHGWVTSIASAAFIPVLSAASLGQMVGSAVVQQLPSDLFDSISNFGKPKKP
jgi:hypothetical protein